MGTEITANTRSFVLKGIFIIGVVLTAIAMTGEWIFFIVCLGKDYLLNATYIGLNISQQTVSVLERNGLKDLHVYVMFSVLVSFCIFWGIGLTFNIYFYKNRRNTPENWKCQPDRWLTRSNEWHEFFLGSFNMLIGSVAGGFISCYIMNGGTTTLYTNIGTYGWPYFLASIPAVFIYNEVASYYSHRCFHIRWLYQNIHKVHHRYGSPTLYSTTAMHPVEFLTYQSLLTLPAFIVPVHAAVFIVLLLYGYYYGMMDHSGIKMSAVWPWQPSSMFHDDHHRYFHCNFGFNTTIFDRFHGTLRKKNHKYNEKIFGGQGQVEREEVIKSREFYSYK